MGSLIVDEHVLQAIGDLNLKPRFAKKLRTHLRETRGLKQVAKCFCLFDIFITIGQVVIQSSAVQLNHISRI